MNTRLLALALLALLPAFAAARDCPAGSSPELLGARFTSAVRSQAAQDHLLYLPPGSREVYIHATTRGTGKITYRWFRDGKRVIDVAANVGTGDWNTWSRLRLAPPLPEELRVQLLGNDGCLLRELSLAATAFVEHPAIRKAWQELAAGDATGAKITLKMLLEDTGGNRALARHAQRMLDTDVAIGEAMSRARKGELFLVESGLRETERRLGANAHDRAARTRIQDVRNEAKRQRARLDSEGNLVVLATRHLLETEKLFRGDYPLWREDADRLVSPALAHAGDSFTMVDWTPTLRGYKLVLQDRRTGGAFEVTPD